MVKKTDTASVAVDIDEIRMGAIEFHILGRTPLIMNRMAEKARQQLLLPPLPQNQAARQSTLKHDPVAEFRGSVYRNRDPEDPALFHMPSGAFKKAIANAALDIPGLFKSTIGRLTSVSSTQISIFGLPKLYMSIVRNSDIKKTPDVRTRAIFPQWCCCITVEYVTGLVTERSLSNLVGASGLLCGIGDYRNEKGAGSNGSYRLVHADDPDYVHLMDNEGRAQQLLAMEDPVPYDEETEELLTWFHNEIRTREKTSTLVDASKKGLRRKKSGNGDDAAALVS